MPFYSFHEMVHSKSPSDGTRHARDYHQQSDHRKHRKIFPEPQTKDTMRTTHGDRLKFTQQHLDRLKFTVLDQDGESKERVGALMMAGSC